MTILDIVSENESTVAVFDSYTETAGECICCNALFETLDSVIKKYSLDGETLKNQLANVRNAAK